MRNYLTLGLLVLMAGSAFAAGYFANDFIELRQSSALPSSTDQGFALFWEAWGHVEDSFIGEQPSQTQLAYGAIRGALSLLNDPYTIFIEPVVREEEKESLQGSFGGIGAYIRRPEEGGDILLEPIPGNPAEAAGILLNDVLLAIDGAAISPEMTVEEVANRLKGEKGTAVTLTVRHANSSESVEITIVRADILIPSVSYRLLTEDESIGYIRLTRFSGESSTEVHDAIVALQAQGAKSLILDLRQNGGGLVDAAVAIADHFLNDGAILYQKSRDAGEKSFMATGETVAGDMPLVILVDGGTASASEIVAGAIQDHGRGELIGSQTYGKGSVQLVYDLSDGSSVHITSARWFTPNHNQIDQQGLTPDIAVAVTQEAIDNGRDEILNRAIEFLQKGE